MKIVTNRYCVILGYYRTQVDFVMTILLSREEDWVLTSRGIDLVGEMWEHVLAGHVGEFDGHRIDCCLGSGGKPPSTFFYDDKHSMIISNSCE